MPSLNSSGSFSQHPLDTDSATKLLRELLMRAGFSWEQVCRISSHSLKATALSWAAKFGISREAREILGYHMVGSHSALHYARDEQAGPLRKLQALYEEIRSGHFQPDNTRSGYKLRLRKPVVWPELEPLVQEPPSKLLSSAPKRALKKPRLDSDLPINPVADLEVPDPIVEVNSEPDCGEEVEAESSTSDSQVSQGNDLCDEELADIAHDSTPLALPIRAPAKAAGHKLYVHSIYSTVHKSHVSEPLRLACGRNLHAGFIPLKDKCNLVRTFCTTCFGSKIPA